MCKRCGESVDHLLLHCPIAYEMWSMIFCLFGICWVMPQRVVDLLDCWTCNFRRHRNIVIWRFVLHYLMWCIWWERNSRSFEGRERSIIEFKSAFGKRVLRFPNVFAFQEFFFFFFQRMNSKSTVHVLCRRQILLFIHCLHTVHGTHNHFIQKKILKMDPTVLFTHLKIILLQCFSVFSFSFQFSAV